MNLLEIIIVSFGLAADAFAVSICKGLSVKKITIKECLIVGLWFGIFQGLMPYIGYLLGTTFEELITSIDHFVAFSLLLYIGIKMILDVFSKDEVIKDDFKFKTMTIFALATSIDALAYGIAYVCAYGSRGAIVSFIFIGIITFITSFLGVKIGNKFGNKLENVSKIIGGSILILLGIKILLEHLYII